MKKWYQSKTIWLNLVTFLAGIGSFSGVIPVDPRIILTVAAIANTILRIWFTTEPVKKSLT